MGTVAATVKVLILMAETGLIIGTLLALFFLLKSGLEYLGGGPDYVEWRKVDNQLQKEIDAELLSHGTTDWDLLTAAQDRQALHRANSPATAGWLFWIK